MRVKLAQYDRVGTEEATYLKVSSQPLVLESAGAGDLFSESRQAPAKEEKSTWSAGDRLIHVLKDSPQRREDLILRDRVRVVGDDVFRESDEGGPDLDGDGTFETSEVDLGKGVEDRLGSERRRDRSG